MPTLDPRVDAYIERAAPFAQEILRYWRATVHAHCPEVVETIKWGFPNFTYRDRILTGMAAFKAHCSIGFWHGAAAVGAAHAKDGAMGDLGRVASLQDLPAPAEQQAILQRAMRLIEDGVKARPAKAAAPRPAARIHRVDRRGKAGRHPREAPGASHRVDGGRQAPQLEIRAPLNLRPPGSPCRAPSRCRAAARCCGHRPWRDRARGRRA